MSINYNDTEDIYSPKRKTKKKKDKKFEDEKIQHKKVVEFKRQKQNEEEEDWEYWKDYYR